MFFSGFLAFLICSLNFFVGQIFLKKIISKSFEKIIPSFVKISLIRTIIIVFLTLIFVKFDFVLAKFFLILLFTFYFVFKIIEIIRINKFLK
jgi:hypothetical protein